MELQGGEEKVFPVQLMAVRRSRNGTVRSIFLSDENSDYSISVMDVFSRSVGRTRHEIEKELKLMELKSQNPKILRGIALVMFRLSRMEKASKLDPAIVRNTIFSRATTPAITDEERDRIIQGVAEDMHTTTADIYMAMYADNEDNEILRKVPVIDPEMVSKIYNMEQIETVILKSLWIDIRTSSNMGGFIRRVRSLGLLYSESMENGIPVIRVSGPVSILEQSGRYGSKLALLVRYILRFSDWELDASVRLKNGDDKSEFIYHLDHSVSEYTGIEDQTRENLPSFVIPNPPPLKAGNRTLYPDYAISIESTTINLFFTTPRYFAEDRKEFAVIHDQGVQAELLCIAGKGEKCPEGAICIKDPLEWFALKDQLAKMKKKYIMDSRREQVVVNSPAKEKSKPKGDMEKIKAHLQALYPDSEAMTDYLEFMGFPVEKTLEEAGFRTRWKGLRLIVTED
jgi:hypothetical protein